MSVALNQVEGFGERHALKQAEPFPRVPVIRKIEAIAPDIFQTCEECLEFRLVRPRVVGPEAHDEPVFVTMPLPVKCDRVVELGGADLGKKARLEHFGDELLTSRYNDRFLPRRRLVPRASADVYPTAPGHGRSTGKNHCHFYPATTSDHKSLGCDQCGYDADIPFRPSTPGHLP